VRVGRTRVRGGFDGIARWPSGRSISLFTDDKLHPLSAGTESSQNFRRSFCFGGYTFFLA